MNHDDVKVDITEYGHKHPSFSMYINRLLLAAALSSVLGGCSSAGFLDAAVHFDSVAEIDE